MRGTRTTSLRSRLKEEQARLENAHPEMASDFRQFLDTYVDFLRLRRQFEAPQPKATDREPTLAYRIR